MDHTHAPSSWLPDPNSNCFWEVGLQQHQHDYAEMDLKQALLRTTLELESTRAVAQEELKKLEAQSLHLAHLLHIATKERDEARHHCHSLLLLLSNSNSNSNSSSKSNPSPNLEESTNTASSPEEDVEQNSKLTSPAPPVREKELPEKGRLVEAVLRAGPLLQTLLMAGQLPQWRHPPPAMQSFEIPPVSISVSPRNDEKMKMMKREEGKQQSPPTSLNLNSTSPESECNANTKFHNRHHNHHQRQHQFGSIRA